MFARSPEQLSYIEWLEEGYQKLQRDRVSGVRSSSYEHDWASRRSREAQLALREIDPGEAQYAQNVSEATAWGVYLRYGLVTKKEFDRARDRPGNALWNYSGQG
jgi:hypothetical protein